MKPATDEEESGCKKKIAVTVKREIRRQVGWELSERGVHPLRCC